jgi:hypothetical protein
MTIGVSCSQLDFYTTISSTHTCLGSECTETSITSSSENSFVLREILLGPHIVEEVCPYDGIPLRASEVSGNGVNEKQTTVNAFKNHNLLLEHSTLLTE